MSREEKGFEFTRRDNDYSRPTQMGPRSIDELSYDQRAALDFMRRYAEEHGLVRIEDDFTVEQFQQALEADRMAGLDWDRDVVPQLLANYGTMLDRCVQLSECTGHENGKGTVIVGVDKNGELAIRQLESDIVHLDWRRDYTRALFHPDLESFLEVRPKDIVEEVRRSAYKLAPCPLAMLEAAISHDKDGGQGLSEFSFEKTGHVAAFEAVTGRDYLTVTDAEMARDTGLYTDSSGPYMRHALFDYPEGFFEEDRYSSQGPIPAVTASSHPDHRGSSRFEIMDANYLTLRPERTGAILWVRS